MPDLRRGDVWWAEFDPVQGREQSGRRPALIVSSNLYLEMADTLAIVLPCTSVDRGWPNHIKLSGRALSLSGDTFAMTEQPRTITRERLIAPCGRVDAATLRDVDAWLRDFMALPASTRN